MAANNNRAGQTGNFPKIEKVPMALNAGGYPAKAPLRGEKDVSDPVVVLVTDGEYFRQATICRPIGACVLPRDSYVFFDTRDVKSTVAAAKDPSATKKRVIKEKFRFDFLTKTGHMTNKGGEVFYPDAQGGRSWKTVHQIAQAAHADAALHAREKYIADMKGEGKQPKKDWKFNLPVEKFWPEPEASYELKIQDFLKGSVAYQEKIKEITQYETKVGPMQDRSQAAAHFTHGVGGSVQLVDTIFNNLKNDLDGTRTGTPHSLSKVRAAFKQCGDDPAKLKEFILYYAFPGIKM